MGPKPIFLWEIYGKLVGSLERYQVEVIWKGPRRVGREVILRAACVRMNPPPNIPGHRDARCRGDQESTRLWSEGGSAIGACTSCSMLRRELYREARLTVRQ